MKPWAERIPAAIEMAEAALTPDGSKSGKLLAGMSTLTRKGIIANLTAGEVALAKALLETHIGQFTSKDCSSCAALRAFAEKVESI